MKNRKLLIFLIFFMTIILIVIFSLQKKDNLLEVHFLDVGQGDAALIETPFGQNILIDGGPGSIVMSELEKYLSFFDKTIDLMILTHPHADHLSGLISVLEKYNVSLILYSGIEYDSEIYDKWLKSVENKNIILKTIRKEQRVVLGENIYLDILFPNKDLAENDYSNVNNSSIVALLSFNEIDFLFMGDAEKEVQEELSLEEKNIEVLKVPHHGADTNMIGFLEGFENSYTVISLGRDNKYGHPKNRVIELLRNNLILRTDQEGTINFKTDGYKLEREMYRENILELLF